MNKHATSSLLLAGLIVLAGAAHAQTMAGTSKVPMEAGEASTMVNGVPNANPDSPMLTKSRSERKMEKEMKKAQRKQKRELAVMTGAQVGAEPGTPLNSPAGNPSVFKGGTPQ
jgi:P pilus assembly chaperone PapD